MLRIESLNVLINLTSAQLSFGGTKEGVRGFIRLVVGSILKVAVAISLLRVAIASPCRLSPRSRLSIRSCVSLVKVRICLLPTIGPRVFAWSSCLVHGDDIYSFEAEKVLA